MRIAPSYHSLEVPALEEVGAPLARRSSFCSRVRRMPSSSLLPWLELGSCCRPYRYVAVVASSAASVKRSLKRVIGLAVQLAVLTSHLDQLVKLTACAGRPSFHTPRQLEALSDAIAADVVARAAAAHVAGYLGG